jgi:hypothetical protein
MRSSVQRLKRFRAESSGESVATDYDFRTFNEAHRRNRKPNSGGAQNLLATHRLNGLMHRNGALSGD